MILDDFSLEMRRIIITYGEKNFSPERVKMFFERYKNHQLNSFTQAVDHVVLFMPPLAQIVSSLDEALNSSVRRNSSSPRGAAEMDLAHPINPRAKELAAHYVPLIRESLKNFGKLPYDPKVRIESEEDYPADWDNIK
jgi:hypothetical protein